MNRLGTKVYSKLIDTVAVWVNIIRNSNLRGPGGRVDDPGKVKIEFSVVPATRCFLPDAFYQIKKYCF